MKINSKSLFILGALILLSGGSAGVFFYLKDTPVESIQKVTLPPSPEKVVSRPFSSLIKKPGAYDDHFMLGRIISEKEIPVFSESADIFEKPDKNSKKIATLSRFSIVKIIDIATVEEGPNIHHGIKDEINGLLATYHLVEFKHGNDLQKGYMWGGHLPIVLADLNDEVSGKTEFMAGLIGENGELKIRAAIVRHGKLIAETTSSVFLKNTDLDQFVIGADVLQDEEKFEPSVKLIEINFSRQACGSSGARIFSWDQKTLQPGPESNSYNDSGIGNGYRYIWPSDEQGKKNCLIVEYTDFGEEDENADSQKPYYESFFWDGENFNKNEDECQPTPTAI